MQGLQVMIVEDEVLVAMALRTDVVSLGYRVIGPASTVARGMALLDEEQPDMALLDVNLRGEYVTPLAEALRERGVPFVLISGYSRDELPSAVLREEATIVSKPMRRGQLTEVLQSLAARAAGK